MTIFLSSLSALLFFTIIAYNVIYLGQPAFFDLPLIELVQSNITPLNTLVLKIITLGGSFKFFLPASLLIGLTLLYRKHWQLALSFGFCMIGCGVLNQICKFIFERPRPEFLRLIQETGFSFPSGHAMGSICFYLFLIIIIQQSGLTAKIPLLLRLAAASLILMIGISRIYLGVHYPSDILAGYCLGFLWFSLSQFLCTKSLQNNKWCFIPLRKL